MSKKAYKQAIGDMGKKDSEEATTRIGIYDSSHGIISADHVLAAISTYGVSQFKKTIEAIWGDKLFVGFLALSITGFGYVGVREFIKLRNYNATLKLEEQARNKALARFRELEKQRDLEAQQQSSSTTSTTNTPDQSQPSSPTAKSTDSSSSSTKKRSGSNRKQTLWQKLKRLLSIAIPSPTSYTAQILIVQFCLLVTRTFLSINCVKASIQAVTHAIGGASWKWWVRWLCSFSLWMAGGIMVNSGLRFGESLLAIQIRSALTQHIHKNYFKGINFYKVNSQTTQPSSSSNDATATPTTSATSSDTPTKPTIEAPSSTVSPITQAMRVSGIENRIVRDVANFSDNIAFLYGHSFKPILEFVLSLSEASNDLGFKRPLTLFGCTVLINLAMRSLQPHLGRMIASESENEGQLQQAHTRIASHVEEIAFMQGGPTEEILIQDKLQTLVFTKIKHNIARVRKSVTDNFIKFGSMLLGGVFCHIPYLLMPELSASQRMGSFRGTEEVMLRCGSAFTEILLLGKELQEVGGHCDRILDVLDALDSCNTNGTNNNNNSSSSSSTTTFGNNTNGETDILICTSEGCSVRSKNDLAQAKTQSTQNLRRSVSGMLIDDSLDQIIMKRVTVVPPEDHQSYTTWFLTQQQELKKDPNAIIEPFQGRLLIANLNLNIPQGKSVLITGPNGCGKTSLFRCLAGLWPIGSGYLYRPSGGVMMVPQNPYLIYGTLRDNVTYPVLYRLQDARNKAGFENSNKFFEKDNDTTSTTIINSHVRFVNEEELDAIDHNVYNSMILANGGNIIKNQPEGLYTIGAWDTKLSGGERQKVGFARVFFHKPAFALLDESTSAVAPEAEAIMYRNVTNAGITVFSIAHRPALRAYHQIELNYTGDGNGGYKVYDLTAPNDNNNNNNGH